MSPFIDMIIIVSKLKNIKVILSETKNERERVENYLNLYKLFNG